MGYRFSCEWLTICKKAEIKVNLESIRQHFLWKATWYVFIYHNLFLLFLQHYTQKTQRASKRILFATPYVLSCFFLLNSKTISLTCLITVLKDRLNLSLNDPICHHFKLSVRFCMSHNLGKKNEQKVVLSIHHISS